MRTLTKDRWMALFMVLALLIALVVMPATAEKKHEIAGEMTMDYPTQERIEVGDTEDHVLSFGAAKGTNECTSKHKFMDGAQVVNMSFSDLVRGSGPHQGYVKFIQDGDAIFAEWEGEVTTTLSAEGTPIMSFEGTFSYIKGTGQFENIQGSGTYKGGFISETEYTVEWEGGYSIAK